MTAKWGYRPQDKLRIPILDAVENGRTPRPLKGFRKPRLVPGHPLLATEAPSGEVMADALMKWADEWDTEWVVVDTHPGAAEHTHGALSVADVVVAPTTLNLLDLEGLSQLADDMSDYPVVVIPNKVPPTPPANGLATLERIVAGTPIRWVSRSQALPRSASEPSASPSRPKIHLPRHSFRSRRPSTPTPSL